MAQFNVRLKSHSYPIVIGQNLDGLLLRLLKNYTHNNRLFVFFDSSLYALHGKKCEQKLKTGKIEFITFVIPGGESAKTQKTLSAIHSFMLDNKISRSDFVLAVGGGVVSDLVGYAAATILRGVKWGVVSTTLLGMVDAAIGGKTGINHAHGKNLIGSFWQPSFVICDLNYLNTLPSREIIAGLGEILKYSGLIGRKMIRPLKLFLYSNRFPKSSCIIPLIKLSAQYKAQIVMIDERESHKRMLLNFGHTFGHAIEKTLGYGKLLHGEAVIIGLLAAVRLSKHKYPQAAGLTEYEMLVRQMLTFVRYYPLKAQTVLNNMKLDKKRLSGLQKFVLLRQPGKPFISADLKEPMVRKSLNECLSIYREIGGTNV